MRALERAPKRVLVPVENATLAEPVLKLLADMSKATELEVELVHIWEPLPFTPPEASYYSESHLVTYREAAEDRAAQILAKAKEFAESHGLSIHLQLVENGDPAESILAVAGERDSDWIVMASHQRHGVSRWFLGSVAERVASGATQPVLTVPGS